MTAHTAPAAPWAEMPNTYARQCRLLTWHIGLCQVGCSDALGLLCSAGERLTGQLVDLLSAFDDSEFDAALVSLEGAGL